MENVLRKKETWNRMGQGPGMPKVGKKKFFDKLSYCYVPIFELKIFPSVKCRRHRRR
jgi:hypothetical protein